MKKLAVIFIFAGIGITIFFTNCNQSQKSTLTSEFSGNLNFINSSLLPDSFTVTQQLNPCSSAADFATCQTNSSVQYLNILKSAMNTMAIVTASIGQDIDSDHGELRGSDAGSTKNGKITWNKASSTVWSVIKRGTGNATVAYISANSGTYVFKYDGNNLESNPVNVRIEANVIFTNANAWSVSLLDLETNCDTAKPQAPSKSAYVITRADTPAGLWTGKAMFYFPRWQAPGAAAVSCATASGSSESGLYADFTGNRDSTKAAIYIAPTSVSAFTTPGTYSLNNFCNFFGSSCGGAGQPTAPALAPNQNPYCALALPYSVTWGNTCPTNAAITGATFASDGLWIAPSDLKVRAITMPSTL